MGDMGGVGRQALEGAKVRKGRQKTGIILCQLKHVKNNF